jgi:hypothetical protein
VAEKPIIDLAEKPIIDLAEKLIDLVTLPNNHKPTPTLIRKQKRLFSTLPTVKKKRHGTRHVKGRSKFSE